MEKLQLIDGAGEFSAALQPLAERLAAQMGAEHLVLGIIGAQSSGKSTLLNALFGAGFAVMDARAQRRQTTRGVWLAALPEHRLTVLDIEGSDSRERWEQKDAAERKTALFGLVLSNLLLINVWHQEIGRFTANSYDILKAVLEINLRDFSHDAPKKILFVVRDFDPREKLEAIAKLLLEDVQRLWSEVARPPGLETAPLNQLVDVDVCKVAHFKFNPDGFAADVAALRRRLLDPAAPDYLFRNYAARALPYEAFFPYAKGVWEAVSNSRDLCIPSQKLAVSAFRAEEIRKETLSRSLRSIGELRARAGSAANLKAELQSLRAASAESFRAATAHYDAGAVAPAAQALHSGLEEEILKLLKALHERRSEVFLAELETALKALLRLSAPLPELLELAEQKRRAAAEAHAEFLRSLGPTLEQQAQFEELFRLRVAATFTRFLAANTDALLARWRRGLEREAEELAYDCFREFSPAAWTRLNAALTERVSALTAQTQTLQQRPELRGVYTPQLMSGFLRDVLDAVKKTLRGKKLLVAAALPQAFKTRFEAGEGGARRNWHGLEDREIERAFKAARASVDPGFALLEQPLVLQLDGEVIATAEELAPLRAEAVRAIEQQLEAAYNVKYNRHSLDRVPGWLWALLLYFMHDNVLAWLSSPTVALLLLALASGTGYLLATGRWEAVAGAVRVSAAPLAQAAIRLAKSVLGLPDTKAKTATRRME